jgi:SIR2-like domain
MPHKLKANRRSAQRRLPNVLSDPTRKELQRAWQQRQLVLFLGAGVSFDYGLPAWRNLVLELLFEEVADDSRLRQIAINYRRAVSDWLADYFDYGPIVLARLIEDHVIGTAGSGPLADRIANRARFLKRIQETIYADFAVPPRRTALQVIADLIAKKPDRIQAVVTFNFDDLLEQELRKRGVEPQPICTSVRADHGMLPIIHAHGYIPQRGDPPVAEIVFTERDYHALTEGVFHWALTEIVWHLRHRTVLFIGLSMSDPNLRRLLDASLATGQPPHYQLQKRHQVAPAEQFPILQTLETAAQQWKRHFKQGINKQPSELFDVLKTTLQQADYFDSALFFKMGVHTIWLEDYQQIPKVLDEIMNT